MSKRRQLRRTAAPSAATKLTSRLTPLGALAAGFGFAGLALAQTAAPSMPAPAAAPSETVMPTVRAKAAAEPTGKDSVRATETRIGKGVQDLRDIPQSVTVVTEKLIDDRNLDNLKDALKNTAGISFQAAEGGEEDIRLRGFSLQATGDIFIDGMRDPAFYERDSFNWDRLEVLRGSASMLFGRGSTGGAVNQVSKQPRLLDENEIEVTAGTGEYVRTVGDFNKKTGEDSAFRLTAMGNLADNNGSGSRIGKAGIAPTYRWGIGTRDEFSVGLYYLLNHNGINYGMPWLPTSATAGAAQRTLLPVDPKNYYGMASDRSYGSVGSGAASHLHRFEDGGELKTALRMAHYERDQHASAIRFAAAGLQPGGQAVNAQNLSNATVLTRGNNLKIQDMDTVYLQSDYSNRFKWFGLENAVLTGVDLAHEEFQNYAATLPAGVTLPKPNTTVGNPGSGPSVNEDLRLLNVNRTFDAKALGVYLQDLVQVAPSWKILGGLRWDRFDGSYAEPANAANTRKRTDSLWSKRFGVLFQPTPQQSYHFSYGTSFNTSGDTYQYDALGSNTPPEGSRNFELGAKLDWFDGKATSRFALFHSTKTNERNRDETSVSPTNYVLSGQRHAAGLEIDLAGRITSAWEVYASYAWIPSAKIDKGSAILGATLTGETVGERPGLTPRHTGTLWTTYQLTPQWRLGAGLNARSSDKPQQSPIVAPRFVTADLMAEYKASQELSYKVNLNNISNKLYADQLYRGHYIPGKGRTLQVTGAYKF